MNATVLDMPTPKKPTNGKGRKGAAGKGKTPKYPSRDKIKYAGLPKEYWDMLDSLTVEGAKYEARSVAYLAKLAVKAFLQAEGKLDEKGKPKGEGG